MIGKAIVSLTFALASVCWLGGLVAPSLWAIAVLLTLVGVLGLVAILGVGAITNG